MIVFNKNIEKLFSVSYRTVIEEDLKTMSEVTLVLSPFNAIGVQYTVIGAVESIDCFNKMLTIRATLPANTGEYSLDVVSSYSGDYSDDDYADDYFQVSDGVLHVAVDNVNVIRETNRTEDNKGIVTWE